VSRCTHAGTTARKAGLLLAGLVAAFTCDPAAAAPLKLPEGPYKYTVIDQDLQATLQAFASNLNLKINISREVRGRVRSRLPELSARTFLDRLCGMYNFEWYFDGQVLHITAAQETQTRLFALAPITFQQFKDTVDALGVSDDRYVIKPAPTAGLVLVAGPPRFVALAEQTLAGLVAEERARPAPGRPRSVAPKDVLLLVYRGSEASYLRSTPPDISDGSPYRAGGNPAK
jgi:type III secretion protein C